MLKPVLLLAIVTGSAAPAFGRETCDYIGHTDYSGTVLARAEISPAPERTQVRVMLSVSARAMLVFKIHYWTEEISEWKDGELQSVAMNNRYIVNGGIVRQQWDYFERGSTGFAAFRVQAKNAEDFRRRYPAFYRYWNPSTFGQSWLQDYPSAHPERRPDLDLKNQAIPTGLRPPLAMAFYWISRLPPVRQSVPLFLPGEKRQPRIDLSLPPPEPQAGEQRVWHIPVHLDALKTSESSLATAWISPSGQLLQAAFDVRSDSGSAKGWIRRVKCEGP